MKACRGCARCGDFTEIEERFVFLVFEDREASRQLIETLTESLRALNAIKPKGIL